MANRQGWQCENLACDCYDTQNQKLHYGIRTAPDPVTFFGSKELAAALYLVGQEVYRARNLWPRPFSCAHEGISVIREEFEELWDEVKLNQKKRDLDKMRKEAVQVAAMAIRFIVEVIDEGRGRE